MPIYLPKAHIQSPSHCQMEMRPSLLYHSLPQKCYSVPLSHYDKKILIREDWMIDEEKEGCGPQDHCVLHHVMSEAVIFVLSSVGRKHGSRSPAMGVSTYSTVHNGGLMKLMGQNTVSILHSTKHLTRLLGLCPAYTHRLGRLILWIWICIKKCISIEQTFRATPQV